MTKTILALLVLAWFLVMALCWTLEASANPVTMTASITIVDAVIIEDVTPTPEGMVHF